MKKLLNTLYVNKEEAYLSLEGETVCISDKDEKLGRFPLHTIESIVCFSYPGASPALMGKCAELGINLAFYGPHGRFLCRVSGRNHGNVLLRKEQYRISDDKDRSLSIARNFILGKIYNARWTIDRTLRDHELRVDSDALRKAVKYLTESMNRVKGCDDLDSLRGIEGESASVYFGVFDEMILNQKEAFMFDGRNRRPPRDRVNAMLSFGYSLLANDCSAALEGVGLDSYVGFMHRDRPGRKSMALDLMEELRPLIVDRFVLTLINTRKVHDKDFIISDSTAVEMTEEGRKLFLTSWQDHKREEIVHPFLKERISWGLVPHVQALLLSRYIRGDVDGYPPFLWK